MRGKLERLLVSVVDQRIIPARAGQTAAAPGHCPVAADHPRACGANGCPLLSLPTVHGSSPRVRGKPDAGHPDRWRFRIIPARAGQTAYNSRPLSFWADHPRACGANQRPPDLTGGVTGSSPRVRGKLDDGLIAHLGGRIIPARAGQTYGYRDAIRQYPDHPRACGANAPQLLVDTVQAGSSPRVRGKLFFTIGSLSACRIIPARAGQTYGYRDAIRQCPDHPRACGANDTAGITSIDIHGSSPRVRGKLDRWEAKRDRRRIIPARAGQTLTALPTAPVMPDHPRACGANTKGIKVVEFDHGSSPRVRGKLSGSSGSSWSVRIIPARAGQTTAPTSS